MSKIKHSLLALALVACLSAADLRVIAPPGVKPVGPYSPGIFAGEFLYVSGQGAKKPDGSIAAKVDDQLRDTFANVKTIVEAGGLTMEHVVFAQVYLTDPESLNEEALNRVWREVFPKNPPARGTIGVFKLPMTPVEVTVVAVRDLARKKRVVPPGYPAAILE